MGWEEYRGIEITRIKKEIKEMIKKRVYWPLLLLGPPGIGKSEIVREALEEIAEELGTNVVEGEEGDVVYYRVEVPFVSLNDLKGLPKSQGDHYTYLPPKWVKALKEAKYGALVLDDITETTDTHLTFVAADIAFTGYVGDTKIDKLIVATGNPKEFSILAESTPLNANVRAGRLGTVLVKPAKVVEWHEYMVNRSKREGFEYTGQEAKFLLMSSYFGVPKVYERLKPLLLCDDFYIAVPELLTLVKAKLPTTEATHNIQTPRSWTASVKTSHYDWFLPEYVASVYEHFVDYLSKGLDKDEINRVVNILNELDHGAGKLNEECANLLSGSKSRDLVELLEEGMDIHERLFKELIASESAMLSKWLSEMGVTKDLMEMAKLSALVLAGLLQIAESFEDTSMSKELKLSNSMKEILAQLKLYLKRISVAGTNS